MYDLRTGAPVSAIDLVELPLNSCLTIGEKSHISVSYHSDYFTVIDDDHHAYCFSVENIVHSSRPQLTRTQTTVDTISVKSFATTIASLDDISDSISVTGSVPGHSFGGPISERVKHRHKNRDFISISRKTPFWISSKKSKDHTITGN